MTGKEQKVRVIDEKTPLLVIAGPLIVGLITMWGLGATVGYTLGIPLGLGVAGVFAGTATDECIRGLIVMHHWRKRKWVGKAIVK